MAPGAVNGGTDEGDARNPEKTQPFAAIVASLARLIRAPPLPSLPCYGKASLA
jgi:hypothetical protein